MTTIPSLLLLILALTALVSVERIRSGSVRVLSPFFQSAVLPALFLLCLSMAIQFAYWYLHRNLNYAGLSVQGIPFSDARAWHDLASSISGGRGFEGSFSGRRPLYPLFLACFYTWLGPSFDLAKILNILLASFGSLLIYLAAARTFNRITAFTVSLAVMASPAYLNAALLIMTEWLAVFLLALSVYLILLGVTQGRPIFLFLAGLGFGLSNMAQSVTLLAFFGLVPAILLLPGGVSLGRKGRMKATACFVVGVLLALGPWLIRQQAVHGILAVSDNMAEDFYAATVPEQGNWGGFVDREARDKGLEDAGSRSAYFFQQALRNIRMNPGFYFGNFASSFADYLRSLNTKDQGLGNALCLLLFLLALYASPALAGGRHALLVGLPVALYLFHLLLPQWAGILIIAGGVAAGACLPPHRISLILTACLLLAGVGISVVGGVILQRAFLLVGWVFTAFYLSAFAFLFRWILSRAGCGGALRIVSLHDLDPADSSRPSDAGGRSAARGIPRWLAGGLLLFFLITSIRLVYVNHSPSQDPQAPAYEEVSWEDRQEIMAAIQHYLPGVFTAAEFRARNAFFENVPYALEANNHGKVLIRRGEITPYLYPFSQGEKINHWSRLFQDRPYARTVLYAENVGYFLFPGRIPRPLLDQDLIFVGRASVDTTVIYEGRCMIEGIALIPLDRGTGKPDMKHLFLISSRPHRAVLASLTSAPEGSERLSPQQGP
jgi:hypothetical protein